MKKEKEYILILGFWVRHTEDKKHYLKFQWKHMISTLLKYTLMGKKIYFTVVKAVDRQEYYVEFLIKNKNYGKR